LVIKEEEDLMLIELTPWHVALSYRFPYRFSSIFMVHHFQWGFIYDFMCM